MLSFEELADSRRFLQEFCLLHVPSLTSLQSGISFKLFPTDEDLGRRRVRHLTATATCLSSLLDCPPRFRTPQFENVLPLYPIFAIRSLRRNWKSEGSAPIYCRCRALPLVIRFCATFDPLIEVHIKRILAQLDEKPERFGIGEADVETQEPDDWSPPNAFHTYWTLDVLRRIETRFPVKYGSLSALYKPDLNVRRAAMLSWARERLGYEISLHSEPRSSVLDTDQLAWSLAIFLRFDANFHSDLAKQDLIKQAFQSLFSTQNAVGTWPHYKPLFHYRDAGNAYCYVFETFATLLHHCVLKGRAESKVIRELLKPYDKKLLDLWRYAVSTQIPSAVSSSVLGWSSGHRINNPGAAESWATASVFSYAQALRRLMGIWCRDQAYSSLNIPRSRLTPKRARRRMASRGETWGWNKVSVSDQLCTMFVNPVRMHKCNDKLEPDSQPIDDNHARSAILFGPPGTSKTTLIRLLADVISWKYVEIHASHFVAEGLTQVQKTADKIFRQLVELDHTVVLFDEIDELVREREMEKDAFGRFLTTSMLPKLAELWGARKILYFVATNHINYFDSAIIRSHRFDALILVSPPSFEAKLHRLTELLSQVHGLPGRNFQIEKAQIRKELEQIQENFNKLLGQESASASGIDEARINYWREQELPPNLALAKFVLLRYDELDELAHQLSEILKSRSRIPRKISTEILREALTKVADSEWRHNKSYLEYLRDLRSERRDFEMLRAWELVDGTKQPIPGVIDMNGSRWLAKPLDSLKDINIPGFRLNPKALGRVQIRTAKTR